jgi:HAD superfamily phosphoserine phosphatase-like hydrolase
LAATTGTRGAEADGTVFLFDLDGTITSVELLPLIARELGLEEEIGALTRDTMAGLVPFDESFRTRVEILAATPVSRVVEIIDEVPVFEALLDWILAHREQCWIVTGNLDCWVDGWLRKHRLRYFSSEAAVDGDTVSVGRILHKETVLRRFAGRRTVMVGDGANDAQIIADADVGIGNAMVHDLPPAVLEVADWVVMEENALCRTLSQL